jgi:subtilisin family serine protease
MPPILIKGPKIPYVKRTAAADDAFDAKKIKLPVGVELTDGSKLRKNGLTGKGVRVHVIDSGVDDTHPGFGGKITKQLWFRYGTDLSEDDHGTHVAGTIHMLAPDAEILDYRFFGTEGDVDAEHAISASIFEACSDGCNVINMSLGGRWPNASIRTAVRYAHSKGVIIVCAAGNEGDGNSMINEIR